MFRALKNLVRKSALFRSYSERRLRQTEISRFIGQADDTLRQSDIKDKDKIRLRYIADLKKYMFTFDEWYFQYNLSEASENEKKSFISRSRAQKWYRTLVKKEVREIFHSKPLFIKTFDRHIKRKTLVCNQSTTSIQLYDILSCSSIIVKPQAGSLGQGIYKLDFKDIEKPNKSDILNKCIKEESLIEECVQGDWRLQQFHPESLNTIRVVTAYDGKNIRVFGSFIRFGRGKAVIDNAHNGGIYCTVDIDSGTICTDAFDVNGNMFSRHPDTGLEFNGFAVPEWKAIEKECCEAHSKVDIPFVGWDVCINKAGEVEFIEGNHAPDLDVMQGPRKTGLREEFERICRGYEKNSRK